MILLELFAGSCSFSDEAKKYGYETITVDNGEAFVDDTAFKKLIILKIYYLFIIKNYQVSI
jgi:ABC-type Fe3+-citrate transport system substrate-binding protein